MVNRTFRDLDELEAMLLERRQILRSDPALNQALHLFHWRSPVPTVAISN